VSGAGGFEGVGGIESIEGIEGIADLAGAGDVDSGLEAGEETAGEETKGKAESEIAQPNQAPAVIPGPSIEQLLQSTKNLWRGGYHEGYAEQDCLSTGFTSLDSLLPGGGWSRQGLIEVVNRRPGVGELQLFLPLMRALIAQGLWVLWVAPPFSPYAPGLAQAGIDLRRVLVVAAQQKQFDRKKNPDAPVLISEGSMTSKDALWCMERALQTPHCGLVLAWQGQLAQRTLRRLQLAAVTGKAMGVLFMRNNSEHSPSSMKLEIESLTENDQQYLDINILKARGSFKPSSLRLQLRDLPGAPLSNPGADRQENREEDREKDEQKHREKGQEQNQGKDLEAGRDKGREKGKEKSQDRGQERARDDSQKQGHKKKVAAQGSEERPMRKSKPSEGKPREVVGDA
jgi:cell division inhibitor SulA/protein ImuA